MNRFYDPERRNEMEAVLPLLADVGKHLGEA